MKKTVITLIVSSVLIVIFTDTLCLNKAVTGFPCPGCGLTRANLHFFKGDFSEAFLYHPLFIFADAILIYATLYFTVLKRKDKRIIIILFAIFIISLFGLYIYRMIIMFPDIEPMTYNYKSLFTIIFK